MVYVFLAQGFEELEAIAPIDLLTRAGIKVLTLAVGGSLKVRGSHGIEIVADGFASDFQDCRDVELIILPGGMPGTVNLNESEEVQRLISSALEGDTRIAAICAAPSVLGLRGLLEGKRAVCYPGFENKLNGATVCDERVVTDGRFTTAKGAGAAVEFGLELVSLLRGADVAEKIKNAIIG